MFSNKDPQHFLYGVILNEVYEHENDLDKGRFENYRHEAQPNSTNLTLDLPKPIPHHMEEWINWIAQHSPGTWSLSIEMKHVADGVATFSFDDITTAVMFKLVFG